MAVTDTLINTLFDGRYLVLRKLGTGGMANVYLAEDQELGRRVAIKILNDRHAADDQFIERFRREASNAARLSHPNIVSIYDRGEAQGTYYIAMEYLEGHTLKELLLSRGPAPVPTAIEYVRQILSALGFAHRNGIVHRDIKPHNVVVGEDGRLKVMDFGIARAGTSQMTEVGSIIGTAQYLSPEQARGAPVDQRSDLYSLGVLLYELLTGQPPFAGDTPLEVAMKHISSPPAPPSSLRPDIPRDLDFVVLRALAKNPAERYQSAEEMERELGRVAEGLGVSAETEEAATAIITRPTATAPTMVARGPTVARPATAYAPPQPYYTYEEERRRRRRPLWPWLLALLLLAAAGVAVFLGWNELQRQLNEARPVSVPLVQGLTLRQATLKLENADLKAEVVRRPHPTEDRGIVFDQQPNAGTKTSRDNPVEIYVSTGPPKVKLPDLRGSSLAAAETILSNLGLKPRVVRLFSDRPPDTVTGQFPAPGELVVRGSTVRINVSRGVQTEEVPSVLGQSFASASSRLQAAGFTVSRIEVESDQPKDTVIDQDPEPGSVQPRGTRVTLTVSKGAETALVPDVTQQEENVAVETLQESGFRVEVRDELTNDPSLSSIVLRQSPSGDTRANVGSTVTIVVGRFEGEIP